MQFVAAILVSWYVNVVHRRGQSEILERHFKMALCLCKPALIRNPRVFLFSLLVVHKSLAE